MSRTWSGFLRDWDRSLRSGDYPETTRYNYLLAAAQLWRYLREYSPDAADAAAEDPREVSRAHVEAFQAWMIETRSASTALNKRKGLQQFFKWLLVDEEAIDRSPMERVRQPKTPTRLIPVMPSQDTAKVLAVCKGKGFVNLRDEALIRLYCSTGARLSEVGGLLVDDVDLTTESVHFHGKGAKDRRVRFGPRTARAMSRYLMSRYLRARGKHRTGPRGGIEVCTGWMSRRQGITCQAPPPVPAGGERRRLRQMVDDSSGRLSSQGRPLLARSSRRATEARSPRPPILGLVVASVRDRNAADAKSANLQIQKSC